MFQFAGCGTLTDEELLAIAAGALPEREEMKVLLLPPAPKKSGKSSIYRTAALAMKGRTCVRPRDVTPTPPGREKSRENNPCFYKPAYGRGTLPRPHRGGKNLGKTILVFTIAAHKSAENCSHHDDRVMGHLSSK
jgi:hypothetical protein